MQELAKLLPQTLEAVKASDSNKLSSAAQPKSLALYQDQEGIKTLSNLLAQCFDVYPLYGREPEAVDNIRRRFRFTLADYPIDRIVSAFDYHFKTCREFPVPSDIAMIIERGNKPPLRPEVYFSLKKKPGEDRTKDEWDYIRDYENFNIRGKC